MRQNKAEVYLSSIDNVDEVQTPSIQARTLCEQFRKRKWIWIVCSIVVVLLIVIIPTTIITIKKKNVTKSVTETASTVTNTEKIELTTESSTTGLTTKASTTAIATKTSTTAITTKTSTIEITTEINTTPKDQFLSSINLTDNTKWKQTGSIIAGGNGHGNKLNQLSIPLGIYINDNDQSIYIADPSNHRIVKWKYGAKTGEVVAGGNGPGIQMNQIGFPTTMIVDEINDSLITCEWGSERIQRLSLQNQTNQQIIISNIRCFGLAMDNNGDLYVADNMNHTVTRWREGDTNGTIVAGGNGQGAQLNQLNTPGFIFVDEDYSIYVSDYLNHRVMKWVSGAIEGIVVAGGQGYGNNLTQLYHPRGVILDHLGNVYVADSGNHRVMRWLNGAKEGSIVIGRNGPGQEPNQLYHPTGISFDQQGNLYVASQSISRVQKFYVSIY